MAFTCTPVDRPIVAFVGFCLAASGTYLFTRAVVLPQGEFARFLHDKPSVRQDLLVQLLGLDGKARAEWDHFVASTGCAISIFGA